jgi:hypothetical protein
VRDLTDPVDAKVGLLDHLQPHTSLRPEPNASSFPGGMCSVTAVRLDNTSPRDRQLPRTPGQPADVSSSIQTPPSTSLVEQGESLIPRYG